MVDSVSKRNWKPNDVEEFAIRRFVEGVISTLKRSPVGVEYTSTTLLGVTRTQYSAQGEETTFQKRLYDPRLGWRETSVRQLTVQDDLVAQLTLNRPVEDTASERDVATCVGFALSMSFGIARRVFNQHWTVSR